MCQSLCRPVSPEMMMRKHLNRYAVQNVITNRLSALSALQTALRRAEQQDSELREALRGLVPASMRQFVDGEEVIETVFQLGRCSSNIVFAEYNFKNFAAAKKAADELRR